MAVTLTVNTESLTEREAGAVAALLVTLYPDALESATQRLTLEALERGTPEQPPVAKWPQGEKVVEPLAFEAVQSDAPLGAAAAFGGTLQSSAPAGMPVAPSPSLSSGPNATATASPSSTLDALGLPWDARIHAAGADGGGVMTDKGVWRKKRGLNQLVEHKVLAELRVDYPAPETPAERTAREAVSAGLVAAPEVGAPLPPAAAPAAPPPPTAPAPATATGPASEPSVPPASAFAALMTLATQAQTAGQLTTADVLKLVTDEGLQHTRELLAPENAHLIAKVRAGVERLIAEAGQ